MKKLFLFAISVLGMAGFAMAQTSGNNSSKNTTVVSSGKNHTKSVKHYTKHKKSNKVTSARSTQQLNNRENYQWKNGQEATPTGHDATSSNGDSYVSQKKDSASKSPKRKQ